MRLTLLLFTGCIIGTISCQQNSANKINKQNSYDLGDFKPKELKKIDEINLDYLISPTRLRYIPEYNIIILADNDADKLLKVFSVDSMKVLKSFGSKGNNRRDFISIGTIDYNNRKKELYINDNQTGSLHIYDIRDVVNNNDAINPKRVISFSRAVDRSLVLPNNTIISSRVNTDPDSVALFSVYDSIGNYKGFDGSYPETNNTHQILAYTDIFRGRPALADNEDKIIFVYNNTDLIDLYNLDLDLLKRISGPDHFEPKMTVEEVAGGITVGVGPNSTGAFRGTPRLTKQGLYVLYDGEKSDRSGDDAYHLLHFDNDINPIYHYLLPEPMFDLDIDTSKRVIYGLGDIQNTLLYIYHY